MSNETYTDLEQEHLRNKLQYMDVKLQLDIIKQLVRMFPNDMVLGLKIREFIKLQE
jgi:hypothetical protein